MQPDWNIIISFLAFLSPVLLVILSGVGWLYTHEKERREAIERQLSERKYNAYLTLLDFFFFTLNAVHTGFINTNQDDFNDLFEQKMFDATKDIIIYGSDDVVSAYHKWFSSVRDDLYEGKINDPKRQRESAKNFGEIVISIRRDMGNQKTKKTSEDVISIFHAYYDFFPKKKSDEGEK